MKRRILVLLAIFALCCTPANARLLDPREWSEPVDGVQGRFNFERGGPVNRTPIIKVFLELRNVTGVDVPIEITYDPSKSIKAKVLDGAGKPLPDAGLACSVMVPQPYYLAVPYKGTLRFEITAYGYGIPFNQKGFVGLHSGAWVFTEDTSEYYLTGTFTIEAKRISTNGKRIWSGTLELPDKQIEPELADNSVAGYFGIKKIEEVNVLFYETMDINQTSMEKRIIDKESLHRIETLLSELSSDGKVYKDFPKTIRTRLVQITHDGGRVDTLTIYGVLVRSPQTIHGSFGLGEKESEFVKMLDE